MDPLNPDLRIASQAVDGLLGLADVLSNSPHPEICRIANAVRLMALQIDEAHGRIAHAMTSSPPGPLEEQERPLKSWPE